MFPVLFSIGPIAISTLGVFSFLAFLWATFWLWKKGKEEGLDEEKLLDTAFLGALAGLVSGRIVFIIEHWSNFGWIVANWLDFSHRGGMSFFGAVAGAMAIIWWLAKPYKWNFWVVTDLAVFGLMGAQILVRLGQFLDGSFFGRSTNLFLGMSFPGVEGRHYPIQLIEIIFLLWLYFWLSRLEKQYRLFTWYQDKRGEAQPGFLILSYGLVYAFFRFWLAFGEEASLYWKGLNLGQWVAGVVFLGSIGGFLYKMGRLKGLTKGLLLWQRINWVKGQNTPILVRPPEPRKKSALFGKRHIKIGSDAKI